MTDHTIDLPAEAAHILYRLHAMEATAEAYSVPFPENLWYQTADALLAVAEQEYDRGYSDA